MTQWRHMWTWWITALLVGVAPDARASIYDVYGMGARGLSLAGAMTAIVDDYTATFYNPGALTRAGKIRWGGGMLVTVPRLHIQQQRPLCLEAAALCTGQYGAAGYSAYESSIPTSFSGITLGWVFPFGGVFERRLALGVSFYVPTINLVRAEALDPQTPQFYMYQNLPDQLVILLALGYEPIDEIAFGVGIQVLADVFGEAAFRMNVTGGRFDAADMEVEIVPKVAATAGVHLRPVDGLQIGVAYRQAIGLEFGLPAVADAEGALVLGLNTGGSVLYTPHQLALGVSYTAESLGLTVSAELNYAMWSLAPDPSPQVEIVIGGDLVEGLGLDEVTRVTTGAVELDFRDTWTPRFGVEWGALDWLTVRAGYAFRPSPAPRATGTFNYLDNDTHQVGFGASFTVPDPFGVHPNPITIELGNQFGVLAERAVRKVNREDVVGDLRHGGFTYSVNLTINHSF